MIGIDIGSTFIKAVEIVRAKKALSILAAGVLETPENCVANGVVLDPVPVGNAVRSLLTTNGFRAKRATISVGGQSALAVRVVDLPKMTDVELRRSMQLDIDRHLPFPSEGTVHDFVKISPPDASPDDLGVEVLLAAAQEPLIGGHVKVLDQARLFPVAIDIEALALCRSLVNLDGTSGPRTTAIINIGAYFTDICIVRDGLLRFVRSAPLAGEVLTNAIGQGLVLDSKQAESLKRQFGTIFLEEGMASEELQRPRPGPPPGFHTPLDIVPEGQEGDHLAFGPPPLDLADEPTTPGIAEPPPLGPAETTSSLPGKAAPTGPEPTRKADDADYARHQISQAILGPLADLAREIHTTFDYFSTRKGMEVERVVLTGGSSKILNLPAFMTRELGVETVMGDPFLHLAIGNPNISPDFLSSISPLMAVCTGLAIRDML